jgi:hypothetical protein
VATIDVRSHTNWVRRALQQSELMTAFEIPYATQSSFPPDFCDRICVSLPNLAPVRVFRLLPSILIPLKGRRFTGGCYPFENFPSRQEVAASKMAKEGAPKSPLALLAPDRQKVAPAVAVSEMAKEVAPKLPFEAPVVGPTS